MNKLNAIEKMGLKVSWKLINIGLFGFKKIPIQLTYTDVFDYLDKRLCNQDNWVDDIIKLICEKDDEPKMRLLIQNFADEDCTDIDVQLRKWRALILKNTLNDLSVDCLQGLLQLMEFWVSMGTPKECPQEFPSTNEGLSVQNYFVQSNYKRQVENNKSWLEREMATIIAEEEKLCI